MQLSPGIRRFLEKLGVNTTRLQWKLYQWEKRRERGDAPGRFHWLRYPHKQCTHCGQLVAREEKTCPKCGRGLHSIFVYRVLRLVGAGQPGASGPTVVPTFLVVMFLFFALGVLRDGVSGLLSPSPETTFVFGGFSPYWLLHDMAFWRATAFGLIHAGIIHIGFNSMALTQVGPLIEDQMGRQRMFVLITFTQITSAALSFGYYAFFGNPYIPTVGASGWLFGLIGFGITYFRGTGAHGEALRAVFIRWAIMVVIVGYFIGANNAAHIGGLIGGMALGMLPEPHPHRWAFWRHLWAGSFWVSVVIWLVTLGFMLHSIATQWPVGSVFGE